MKEKDLTELYELLVSVKNVEDCKDLLTDLCTPNELENMLQRIQAAKLFMQNKTYNQVTEETGVSAATLSRVSHSIKYGKGYKKFIKP